MRVLEWNPSETDTVVGKRRRDQTLLEPATERRTMMFDTVVAAVERRDITTDALTLDALEAHRRGMQHGLVQGEVAHSPRGRRQWARSRTKHRESLAPSE